MLTLGYLGSVTTFSAQGARVWANGKFTLVGFDSILDLLGAFVQGKIDRAFVPLENVLGDVVHDTIDFFMTHSWTTPNLRITKEVLVPIRQMLMGKPGTDLTTVTEVLSHPQALSQCTGHLAKYSWKRISVSSTEEGVKLVSQAPTPTIVAIGSEQAAKQYGLTILASDIGDSQHNVTRFIVLGGPKTEANGACKTTLFFSTRNQAGALYHPLGVFFYQGLNLSRITSYTAKRQNDYYFWLDVDGHESDPVFAAAIKQLQERFVDEIVVVGSYPKAEQLLEGV